MAKEHIDECTDEELEEFLKKAQPVLINLVPEPDDYDLPTSAGFVSRHCTHNSVVYVHRATHTLFLVLIYVHL